MSDDRRVFMLHAAALLLLEHGICPLCFGGGRLLCADGEENGVPVMRVFECPLCKGVGRSSKVN